MISAECATGTHPGGSGGRVVRRGPGQGTTLVVDGLDPAAERALMTLLWDSGHDVVSMRSTR